MPIKKTRAKRVDHEKVVRETFHFRVTEDDARRIRKMVPRNCTVSEYLRTVVLGHVNRNKEE